MRRILRKIISMAMAVALLVGTSEMTSLAAENVGDGNGTGTSGVEILEAEVAEMVEGSKEINPRTMLAQCIISVVCDEEGMHVGITTGSVGTASVLGVKDIKIQKKVWYGWSTVATSSGGELYNLCDMGVTILYANAEYGETYRIKCVHYGQVTEYTEVENNSGAFVFTY